MLSVRLSVALTSGLLVYTTSPVGRKTGSMLHTSVIVDLCFLEFYDPENAKKTQKNCWNRWDSNTWWPKSIFAELTVAMKRRNSKKSRKQQKPENCCQILHVISMPLEPVRVSYPVSGFQVSRNPENVRKHWKTMKTNETKGKKIPKLLMYWAHLDSLHSFQQQDHDMFEQIWRDLINKAW